MNIEIDGIRTRTAVVPGQTVADILGAVGLHLEPSDLVSLPLDAQVVPGQYIVVDRGLPFTLIDGGTTRAVRSRGRTAGELVASLGLVLGPLDRVEPALDTAVSSDATVRIRRVADRQETAFSAVPHAVRYLEDPSLLQGIELVETPGAKGEVQRTYAVRYIDGVEAARELVAESWTQAPVAEIRIAGTRARPAPAAPAEIETIIRAAATTWGADPDQLLRIAWCESRFNPGAYNASGASGLFQFMPATFARHAPRAGFSAASIWDPEASANTAAMLFASGQSRLWACR
ncbi:MAG: transglycosylase SLT domain-containing protein [Chloroflexi bacterium]|nr:transglycosylase SLT domain-containing protein [Chloroflexota bacterium]